MDFFQDKRFWHAIAALIVVVILAVMFWPRNQPTVAPAAATPNSPATVPTPLDALRQQDFCRLSCAAVKLQLLCAPAGGTRPHFHDKRAYPASF